MIELHYNWSKVREQVLKDGMKWNADWVPDADVDIAETGVSQAQFGRLLLIHMHYVRHLFTPRNYGFLGRVKMAYHFMFRNTI